jgi:hypothetical protein
MWLVQLVDMVVKSLSRSSSSQAMNRAAIIPTNERDVRKRDLQRRPAGDKTDGWSGSKNFAPCARGGYQLTSEGVTVAVGGRTSPGTGGVDGFCPKFVCDNHLLYSACMYRVVTHRCFSNPHTVAVYPALWDQRREEVKRRVDCPPESPGTSSVACAEEMDDSTT